MNEEKTAGELLRAFHDDEEGLEILQVVLIIALAAIIFIVIRAYWAKSKAKSDTAVDKATEGLDPN
jgi:hypothetical protein